MQVLLFLLRTSYPTQSLMGHSVDLQIYFSNVIVRCDARGPSDE